ncbi:hypothetical protein ACIBI9_66510 [Nonomuraea sp. NPDC050451]|uniref:effector-associated constant component EACC1 n=1 Tax=Nonomuraea sp. NPDC050451 TaxID=3364364 RepID=UPI00378ADE44
MDVRLTFPDSDSPDLPRGLQSWLTAEPELAGRVRVISAAPPPGTLGAVTDGLLAVLGPGGGVVALVGAVIAWLRYRTGRIRITFSSKDGESKVELTAERVKALDAAGTKALVEEIVKAADQLREDETDSGR